MIYVFIVIKSLICFFKLVMLIIGNCEFFFIFFIRRKFLCLKFGKNMVYLGLKIFLNNRGNRIKFNVYILFEGFVV